MNIPNLPARETAVVIGGGIVGVCCGLYLQREGYLVTLVDPSAPGDSTAKWSCGLMAVGEIIPLSKPGILMKVPGWLLDQKGPLALRPSALPAILPWFVKFAACARQTKIVEISTALASLTREVYSDYAPLLEACDDKSLLGQRPVLEMFDSATDIEREHHHFELRESLGFRSQRLNSDDISDLEPAFAARFDHGMMYPEWRTVSDTEGFIASLTKSFVSQGGVRIRAEVSRIDEALDRATGVTLANGERISADHLVVAAGMGSRRFFGQLGINVPLEGIAGYQVLLSEPGVEIRHSVAYSEGGFFFSPMTRGLQIGGTIEFAGRNAQPNFKRAEIILEKARRILPELQIEKREYGVGYRPFLPDTKPVIDRSARFKNVYLAFGHGQLGLTLGATTGRLVGEMIKGKPTSQDLKPFSARRFT
jgi:D-amino-acid dehydrogenase